MVKAAGNERALHLILTCATQKKDVSTLFDQGFEGCVHTVRRRASIFVSTNRFWRYVSNNALFTLHTCGPLIL